MGDANALPARAPGAGALRVGIDVGGTFTDVVAVDAATREIVARIKTPTTHRAPGGVAEGIVAGLRQLLARHEIDPARIAFIAHSTTQATNALLEGDVARVGILGLHGRFAAVARAQMRIAPLRLGPNATLAPAVAFARAGDADAMERALDRLEAAGSEAIAASEPFAVDGPAHEREAVERARKRGRHATAGHEVATTYGLRVRTRTAMLNAAMLPTMVRTAEMTARAVEAAGIGVPLMIMRSDGGVMDVREVARRPIATMLSGPAAGIAGALFHERVTDGIFIEVGGTSADASVVRRGAPQMRPARVGGHRTMLRALDARTIAVAGGSLVRVDPSRRGAEAVLAVGPRSAHIAGYAYAAFSPPDALESRRATLVRPQQRDAADYLVLTREGAIPIAPTPSCAATALEVAPPGTFARGNVEAARRACDLAGAFIGCDGETFAIAVLRRAAHALGATIDELIADYDLDRATVELIGGGGGAAALVPFAARELGFDGRLAHDAEVISPLGVALALVRDVVERTIVDPGPDDVVRIRREALERAVAAGAAPEFVTVTIEIDARRNLVRAIAAGAAAAVGEPAAAGGESTGDARLAAAGRALRAREGLAVLARAGEFEAIGRRARDGLEVCIVGRDGVVRAILRRAEVRATTAGALAATLGAILEDATTFGDVGRALPEVLLAYGQRCADLGTLAESAQVLALAGEEIRGLDPATPVLALAARRDA